MDSSASLARVARRGERAAAGGRRRPLTRDGGSHADPTSAACRSAAMWRSGARIRRSRRASRMQIAWLATDRRCCCRCAQYLSVALDCGVRHAGACPASRRPRRSRAACPPTSRRWCRTSSGSARGVKRTDSRVRCASACRATRKRPTTLARMHVVGARTPAGQLARPLLAEAYGQLPDSRHRSPTSTATSSSSSAIAAKPCASTSETLGLEPVHDNAMLGRTVCLAFLKRFDEAIAVRDAASSK